RGLVRRRSDDDPVTGGADARIRSDAAARLACGDRSADRSVVARSAFVGREVQACARGVALRRDAGGRSAGAGRAGKRVRAAKRAAVAAVAAFKTASHVAVAAGRGHAAADAAVGIRRVAVVALLSGKEIQRAVVAARQRAVGIAVRRIDAAAIALLAK